MKRLLMMIGLMGGLVLSTHAQKTAFRIEAGASFNDMKLSMSERTIPNTKILTGYHVGVNVELGFADYFYFAPGLHFKSSGVTIDQQAVRNELEKIKTLLPTLPIKLDPQTLQWLQQMGQNLGTDAQIKMHYLQVPLMVGFRTVFGDGWHYSLEGGPYLAYGIGGDSEMGGKSMKSFDKEQGFKRFDWGLGASMSVGYSYLYLRVGGELGLQKQSPKVMPTLSGYHRDFYTTLGLRF